MVCTMYDWKWIAFDLVAEAVNEQRDAFLLFFFRSVRLVNVDASNFLLACRCFAPVSKVNTRSCVCVCVCVSTRYDAPNNSLCTYSYCSITFWLREHFGSLRKSSGSRFTLTLCDDGCDPSNSACISFCDRPVTSKGVVCPFIFAVGAL